jgi:hypothetical protein
LYAGTIDTTIGLAALGRACVAFATLANIIAPSAPRASASGSAILFLNLI